MKELLRGIKARGHCVLEMPSGTGKTISLLSLIISYMYAHPEEKRKLVYCTRTVPEMEKVLEELRHLQKHRIEQYGKQAEILAIGLSSRKNLCIHPTVSKEISGTIVDSKCLNMTANWVREKASEYKDPSVVGITLCDYFETLENDKDKAIVPAGVYTLESLKRFVLNRLNLMCI